VILTRIHPGIAALAVVAGLTAALLIVQSIERKPVPQLPQATAPKARQESIRSESTSALAGIARVVDGDTINIRGRAIRLDGIDAPETKQTCELNGQTYSCGVKATEELITLLGGKPVECIETGKDRNSRTVGSVPRRIYRHWNVMVEHGWAVAFRNIR
jgi:Micrococcal nuclease (thermonuclease) homologs